MGADIGATHSRVAVTDLRGEVLVERAREIAVAEGPDPLLTWLEATIEELLGEAGRDLGALRGIGVGLPGPVEHVTGRAVNPPIMPGWNHYPVSERLSQHFGVPALVDNDVNIMAVGEHWVNWRDEAFLLFVKIGTGIGSGIVAGGHVHRGADGAAGDIGHIHVRDHDDVVCRCGNVGCLEAVAGGRALANRLQELGLPTTLEPRRRAAGAGRPARRRAAGAPGRPRDRRRPGRLREHPQPGGDRDRRRHRGRRRAPAGRDPRGRLPALDCRWPPVGCGSCPPASATPPASSARR